MPVVCQNWHEFTPHRQLCTQARFSELQRETLAVRYKTMVSPWQDNQSKPTTCFLWLVVAHPISHNIKEPAMGCSSSRMVRRFDGRGLSYIDQPETVQKRSKKQNTETYDRRHQRHDLSAGVDDGIRTDRSEYMSGGRSGRVIDMASSVGGTAPGTGSRRRRRRRRDESMI